MVFGRQDLLREVAALVARARLAEDSQKAADLIKQAADILETVAELLAPGREGSLASSRAEEPRAGA
jgi:hypothetical protein